MVVGSAKLTYDEDNTKSFELDRQRSVKRYPLMKEPRAWERDSQAGSDALYCSSECGSFVLFEVFLRHDLKQERKHVVRA